jgi:hypothetical protein
MVQLVCCVVASTVDGVIPVMPSDGGKRPPVKPHGWRTTYGAQARASSGGQRMDTDCPATSWARRGQGFDSRWGSIEVLRGRSDDELHDGEWRGRVNREEGASLG